jgi:hypothetical protein
MVALMEAVVPILIMGAPGLLLTLGKVEAMMCLAADDRKGGLAPSNSVGNSAAARSLILKLVIVPLKCGTVLVVTSRRETLMSPPF